MKRHVKNYLKALGYSIADRDTILCERCGKTPCVIHHIVYKSQGGSDEYKNLIALCTGCHELAHKKKISKEDLLFMRN